MILISSIAAGQNLPVGVTIVNGQNQVNQIATYRFTLIPSNLNFAAGTIIQTTFPEEVNLSLNSAGQVKICSRYTKQTSTSQTLACNYDKDLRQLTFTIEQYTSFEVAYEYDVGEFVNPGYSTFIFGIDIKIKDSNSQIISESDIGTTILQIVPGSITDSTLKYSSNKVSDPCTYTFEFSITNDITPGGLIKIDFPTPQITVPSLTNSMVSIKVYGQEWRTPPQISTPTNQLVISGVFPQGLIADKSQKIQIRLQSIVNPGSLQETKSFQISTLNSASFIIDQVSTGMTVKPIIPGIIGVRYLTASPQTVGQPTNIYINIVLPQAYSSGYLLITLPPEIEVITLTCQILIGFFQQVPDCTLVNSSKQIIRVNNQPSSTQIYFAVGTIKNPSYNKTTSSIQIQSFDAQNFLQSQILTGLTYTPSPGSLSEVLAIRSKTQIGASADNSLTLNFKAMNSINNGQQIVIRIPTQQMQIQNNNVGQIKCKIKIDAATNLNDVACQVDVTNSGYFQVSMNAQCPSGCSPSTKFAVQINGVQNPQWKAFSALTSVEIYTMTSDLAFTIDQIKSALFIAPDLVEGPLSSVLIYQNGSHIVGSQTSYSFAFTIEDSIPQNGFLRLYFPTNAVYAPFQGGILCTSQLPSQGTTLSCSPLLNQGSSSQNSINYIEMTGVCPNGCASQTQFKFTISKLSNPNSIKNITNNFAIRTFTPQGYYIDLVNVTDAKDLYLVAAQFASLALTSPSFPIVVGAFATYNIQITPKNSIDQYYGKIEIEFPKAISLDQTSTCSATGSNQVFKCQIDFSSNIFKITNPNNKIVAGTIINFGTQAINPLTTKKSSSFKIQSFQLDPNDSSNQYIVESDISSLAVQPDSPNILKNVTVIRSVSEIDDPSDFYINFTTTNPIPRGSTILLSLPSGQILKQEQKEIQFLSITQDNSPGIPIQIQSMIPTAISTDKYTEVGLQEWCTQIQVESSENQLDSCPPGTTLKIKITNARNPLTTKPPSESFRIVTQTLDGFQIDAVTQNVFASPILSAGPFLGTYMDQSIDYVGASTSLKLSVIIQDDIPTAQGSIRLVLPPNMYYIYEKGTIAGEQIVCQTEGQPTNCSQQTQGTSIGSYISQIGVNLNCSSKPCIKGTNRTVQISNIRNKFNAAKMADSDTIQVATLDGEGYTINAQVVNFGQTDLPTYLIPNNNATILTVELSNSTTGSSTSIKLNVKTETRLQSNSFIKISLPADQFVHQQSSVISCQDYQGRSMQCTSTSNSSYHEISYQNQSLIPDNSTLILSINGLINRYNTHQVDKFASVSTFTPNMDAVDKSKEDFIIKAKLSQAIVKDLGMNFTNTIIGAKTEFQINFRAQNGILPGDSVIVDFSNGILISSGNEQCAMTIEEQIILIQSDKCQIKTDYMTELITQFSIIAPVEVSKDSKIIFSLINATNLLEKRPLSSNISVHVETSPTELIAAGNISLNNQDILQPNQFSAISFIRLNSPKLQTKTDVDIKVSVPIKILPNAKFIVVIPVTQFRNTDEIQCLSQGSSFNCNISKSNDGASFNITTSDIFCTNSPKCDPQSYLFTLRGLQNPDQVSPDIQPIKVWMLTSNNSLILDSSNLTIYATPPLQVGDLLEVQISQLGSKITGTQSEYQINFKLPLNIANTCQLILRFPNMTVMPDSVPLNVINKALNFVYNYTTVLMNGPYIKSIVLNRFCYQSVCNSTTLHDISVQNIRNVEFVRPRNKQFQIQIITQSGFVLNQNDYSETGLPQFIENQLKEETVTRGSKQLSQNGVDLIISFKTPNRISQGSYIMLSVPLEQVSFPNYKSISCFDGKITSQIVDCKYVSNANDIIQYNVSEWCVGDCQANQTLSLLIKNTQNPSQLSANYPNSYFSLKIYNQDGYLIETSTSELIAQPSLSGIPINNIQISRDNGIVGRDDYLIFVIPISTLVDVMADLVLNFTQGQFLRPSDQQLPSTQLEGIFIKDQDQRSIYCAYTYYDDPTSTNVNYQYGIQSIKSITMTNVCSQESKCEASSTITVKLKIRNQLTPLESNKSAIKLSLKSATTDLGMGSIQNTLEQLQPNQLDVQLKDQPTSCNQTGALCLLEMVVTTSNPVPSDSQSSGQLIIQIPQQMTIRASECTAYLMDIRISCFVNDQKQITVRYQQKPTTLSNIQTSYIYRIVIQNLENPYSTKISDSFNIYSQIQSNNKAYIIDRLQQEIRTRVTSVGQFDKVELSRSNFQLDQLTDLSFKLQNRNFIPNNGSLFIKIPPSQIIRQQQNSQQCSIQTNSNKPLKCAFLEDGTIQVDGICADSNIGCTQNQEISFQFKGSQFKNPVYQKDPLDSIIDSLDIYSAFQSEGNWFRIDQTKQGLYIAPSIVLEKLVLTNLFVTSSKTSEYAELTFIAAKENSGKTFQNDNIRIKFDPPLFNNNPYHTIQASINNKDSQVVAITQMNNQDFSRQIVYLTLACDEGCKGSQQLTIQIFDIQNPYFTINDDSLANSQLFLQELQQLPDQVVSQGQVKLVAPIISKLQLAPITQAQLISYNPNTTQENTIDVQFALANNPTISHNAQIALLLPSAFASTQQANQIKCSNIFTEKTYKCNYLLNNSIIIEDYYKSYTEQNNVVAIKIKGVINPSKALKNGIVTVSIVFANQLYAYDDKQLSLSIGDTSSAYCISTSGCQQCIEGGACAQCAIPSDLPLLQESKCVQQCASGYFEYNLKCYKCAEGCQECSSYDQCTKCDKSSKFIDGSCEQLTQCPTGTKLDSQFNQCLRTTNCDSQCNVCGVSPSYCYLCSQGLQSKDGQCLNQCPSTYFSNSKNKCIKCNSLCAECIEDPNKCIACRKGIFGQGILDLGINSCVSTCSNFSIPRKQDPSNFCDPCSSNCWTCSGEPNQCTSCYYDKKTKEDLFYIRDQGECVYNCPAGSQENYSTHVCETSLYKFAAFPPIYLLLSGLSLAIIVTINRIITRCDQTKSSDVALAFLTFIEFLNRVFLLANLWFSTKSFSFCITGVDILANSFLSIYFVTLVVQPIAKQIQAIETQSHIFSATVILAQFSGINSIRLLTSQFMGLNPLSNRYTDILYYVKQLELLSILSSLLCIFQLFVGISCIFDFGPAKDAFGLGINAIIFNVGLLVMQTQKYYLSLSATKVYHSVQRRPQ